MKGVKPLHTILDVAQVDVGKIHDDMIIKEGVLVVLNDRLKSRTDVNELASSVILLENCSRRTF